MVFRNAYVARQANNDRRYAIEFYKLALLQFHIFLYQLSSVSGS